MDASIEWTQPNLTQPLAEPNPNADREAIGLDISPTGIAAARARLAALPEGEVKGKCQFELASFFTYSSDEKFTSIYDYTFLCASPPEQRGEWAAQMKALLAPETGLLITLIYPISETKVHP